MIPLSPPNSESFLCAVLPSAAVCWVNLSPSLCLPQAQLSERKSYILHSFLRLWSYWLNASGSSFLLKGFSPLSDPSYRSSRKFKQKLTTCNFKVLLHSLLRNKRAFPVYSLQTTAVLKGSNLVIASNRSLPTCVSSSAILANSQAIFPLFCLSLKTETTRGLPAMRNRRWTVRIMAV